MPSCVVVVDVNLNSRVKVDCAGAGTTLILIRPKKQSSLATRATAAYEEGLCACVPNAHIDVHAHTSLFILSAQARYKAKECNSLRIFPCHETKTKIPSRNMLLSAETCRHLLQKTQTSWCSYAGYLSDLIRTFVTRPCSLLYSLRA